MIKPIDKLFAFRDEIVKEMDVNDPEWLQLYYVIQSATHNIDKIVKS